MTLLTQGQGTYNANIKKNFTKQYLVVNQYASHISEKEAHDKHSLKKTTVNIHMNTQLCCYLNFLLLTFLNMMLKYFKHTA